MLSLFRVNLQPLKINCISDSSILIGFIFNFTFLNSLFLNFLKILFAKNNILLICMIIILNIFFLVVINKYELYINGIIKSFFLW